MAQDICVIVSSEDRARLVAVIADRKRPHKHVLRARIIFHRVDRLPTAETARRAGVSRPAVWRWQRRYAAAGVEGLLRDKTRRPGKAPLPQTTVAQILALTCTEPPGTATQWTGRAIAKAVGVSLRSVQPIWEAHRLQPHRLRTFKRSTDPAFVEKVEDIVGLYMDPPAHAVVMSIDEKSQIQALDRTQPGLPLKPGKCRTRTHDYKRNGITTLFAALDVLNGAVLGRCMTQHGIANSFASSMPSSAPCRPERLSMTVLHNYATHKHPKVGAWLADHPRWVFHFTPTSASWLNAVESFFSTITRRRIRRGVFKSVADLEHAIAAYIGEHNTAKPFLWTKPTDAILTKLRRLPVPSE
jgi:transposase